MSIVCPFCKSELDYVNVYSEAYQKGRLDDENRIISYSDTEILETYDIECPECHEKVNDFVEEV